MSINTRKHSIPEIMIGILTLCIGIFLAHQFLSRNTSHGKSGYKLYASFSSVNGLSMNSDVKICGMKVGEITSLNISDDLFAADAEVAIFNNKINIPDDSIAAVKSESLLGSKYVEIISGTSEEFLTHGNHIVSTKSAINLEDLVNKFLASDA